MRELWVPVSAAIAQQRKVETLANNVANANTPGFKKDQLVFKEQLTALSKGLEDTHIPRKEFAPEDFYHSQGNEHAFVKVDGSYVDFQQGQLAPTGNPMDLGIRGKGLVEVLTPRGIRYTRNATLSLSKDGELVTNNGHKVLSAMQAPADQGGEAGVSSAMVNPESRVIRIPPGKFDVNMEGEVFINGNQVGKISMVEFNDLQRLRKEDAGLFINKDEENVKRMDVASTMHQGFVEESNVNAIHEMSELIKAHRHFESINNVIKAYDSMANKGANEIARF